MPRPPAAPILLGALVVVEILVLALGPDFSAAREKIAGAAAAQPSWEDDADAGIHIAAWINLGLLALLLVTRRWWARAFITPAPVTSAPAAVTPRWFWPGVLALAMLCVEMRLPLASKSLWWDEAWVVRQCSLGRWQPDKKAEASAAGALKFSPASWKRCAFYYQKPTNHVPMSLAQKAGFSLWRRITGAAEHEFSDLVARVPALLASAGATVLIALLGRAWGRPGVGVLAALLLALHPWHMRYGVDARAYALVAPLCLSALLASWRIAQSGGRRAREWIWLGANQFLWLWAYPNALPDVLVLFAVLAVTLWREHTSRADRLAALARLLVCHALAAMFLLQMFLPCVMQARHWAGQEPDKHLLTPEIARETARLLMLGTPWQIESNPFDQKEASGESATAQTDAPPSAALLLARVLWFPALLLAAAGLWIMRVELGGRVWIAWSLVISALLFAALTRLAESYFYSRFVFALTPLAMLGLAWNARHLGGATTARQAVFTALPVLAGFFVATSPAREVLLAAPISPLRDVAEFVTKRQTPDRKALVACYGLGRETMPVYLPEIESALGKADIEALIARARKEGREFLLVQGYDSFNRARLPDGFALMDDPAVFEQLATFTGIEADFCFRVLRAK